MTKLPAESWKVTGVTGPKYRVGPYCSVPDCHRFADHAHHIWRRSFIGGDYRWVKLWDDTIVANLTGLCVQHHQEVTENFAVIKYMDDGVFYWAEEYRDEYEVVGELDPQPGVQPEPSIPDHDEEDDTCPTCGHKARRRVQELPPGPRRPRKSWSVRVPADSLEDGAQILDELEQEVAEAFGIDHYSNVANRRYFSIVQSFALILQNAHMLKGDE